MSQDFAAVGVADLLGRHQLGARRGKLERLADLPRPAEFLHLALQVAPGHVERNSVAEYAFERVVDRDVGAARFQGHCKFDLVMNVLGHGRIGEVTAFGQKIVGVLLKEEGRLTVRIVAHLDGVGGVISTDAINAVDGKGRVRCRAPGGSPGWEEK